MDFSCGSSENEAQKEPYWGAAHLWKILSIVPGITEEFCGRNRDSPQLFWTAFIILILKILSFFSNSIVPPRFFSLKINWVPVADI